MVNEQSVRVVIAEDDFLVSEEIKRSLRGTRYQVVGEANNGEQAVGMVKQLGPDVVLLDIKMPKVDGLEAARMIQRECPTPVVILTAHESRELVVCAGQAGAGAYLLKPPNTTEIDRAITLAIARHADLMEMCRLNAKLAEALSRIKALQGILPLCSYCMRIRTDNGTWQQVDYYIHEHSAADVSHTVCPHCLKKYYPELDE